MIFSTILTLFTSNI